MSENEKQTVAKKFYSLLKNANHKKVLTLLLPFQIGASLSEFLFGNELQEFISRLNNESEERQFQIIKMLEMLMDIKTDQLYPVLTIGSANAETIFKCGEDIILGNKHNSEMVNLYGGSGVNFAMRLLAGGDLAIPVLPVGDDDVGRKIIEAIRNTAEDTKTPKPIINFLGTDKYLHKGIKTPTSGILISGAKRTIFKQNLEGQEYFHEHLLAQLKDIEDIFSNNFGTVMIGHIQSDKKSGTSTKEILNRYQNRALIYTVLGNSQIGHGLDFWEKEEENIFNYIDVFQLNMEEAKRLFRNGQCSMTSEQILEWFRKKKLSAVLTLDKFGAIGTYRDSEYVYVAYPLLSEREVIDSTGACDAFPAGMVSYLGNNRDFDDVGFSKAMQKGRLWASCACKHVGGTGKQPSSHLKEFIRKNPGYDKKNIEVREVNHTQELLKFIDLIYQ